jgi:hypothetical protein
MNFVALRALTWGTVAAAVVSAMLLAAAESGWFDVDLGADGGAVESSRQAPAADTGSASPAGAAGERQR